MTVKADSTGTSGGESCPRRAQEHTELQHTQAQVNQVSVNDVLVVDAAGAA